MPDNRPGTDHVPVVIIVPPFQTPFSPTLATGLLKRALVDRGIGCKVIHANMITFNAVGMEAFTAIASYHPKDMVSDRLFASYAADGMTRIVDVPSDPPDYLRIFDNIGEPRRELSPAQWLETAAGCGKAIDETTAVVARLSPRIVAFSLTYTDALATIAFARRIRKALPDAVFLLGGCGCPAEMGEEMLRAGGVFDFLFMGEADHAFPDFCQNYLTGGVLPEEPIIECGIVHRMDTVPIPDYSDFVEARQQLGHPLISLSFESSRGCGWGAHKPCNFCADACYGFDFRVKSPERMMEELTRLREDYPDCRLFTASDLMIPPPYFDGFFQWLASSELKLNFVYQTNTKLDKRQLALLRKAGCAYFLAGIESLSSAILQLLNKGTSPAANLLLLRNSREVGVNALWNTMVGIPGDRRSHYQEQLHLMPALHHLHPPHLTPLALMRFSAYTRHPERFGIRNLRPLPDYARIYPPHFDVNRLAFYFEADFPSESLEQPHIPMAMAEAVLRWIELWHGGRPPVLRMIRNQDGSRLAEDTRPCARQHRLPLDEEQYELLCRCRAPRRKEALAHAAEVELLLENKMLVEVDGKILSVVCDEEGE